MTPKKAPAKKALADSLSRRSSPAFARREEPPMFPPVNRAAMDNDVANMSKLLDAGASIEERDRDDGATPLIGACRYNNPLTALELIKRGADVNAVTTRGTSTAIGWAAVNGMVEVGRALILKGCSLDVEVNGCKTIQQLALRNRDRHEDFYNMIPRAIEERDLRRAREAEAAQKARDKAYSEGATVLDKPMTVAKPITLKR